MSRNVLIVLSNHDAAGNVLQHAIKELFKPGDRFHLLWVTNHAELLKEARAVGEQEPVGPGLDAEKSRNVEEHVGAVEEKKEVAAKFGPSLNAKQIPYEIHILPTNALHAGEHIALEAGAVSAALVVVPKASSTFLQGYVAQRCSQPVVLI